MKKLTSNLFLTAIIAFIAGLVIGIAAFVFWRSYEGYKRREQRGQAVSFFYRTMNNFFNDTYNPQEGSIYKDALEVLKEYKPQLDDKCWLFLSDTNPSYYEGTVVFPSGDCFYVYISRTGSRHEIIRLVHRDWEQIWKEIMYRNKINT